MIFGHQWKNPRRVGEKNHKMTSYEERKESFRIEISKFTVSWHAQSRILRAL